jgi:uncharacterized membrane protein YsdA (DUF1294 family)
MQTMDVTWGRAAKVWWSIIWRSMLVAAALGGILGFLLGMIFGAMGLAEEMFLWSQLVGVLSAVFAGVWSVKQVLSKEYRDYRLVLVPSTEARLMETLER